MNISDVFSPFQKPDVKEWQLGAHLRKSLNHGQVVILTCSDYRGVNMERTVDFSMLRNELYQLASIEAQFAFYDLGDLISGKTLQDTHYILQEVLLFLFQRNCKVIVVGGGSDLSYALFSAVNSFKKSVRYAHFCAGLDIHSEQLEQDLDATNFLAKIFDNSSFHVKDFTLLGYQRHLTSPFTLNYLKEVNFDTLRLSEILSASYIVEPRLRFADLVTMDANVLETMREPIAFHPQVNGLNRREICSCMQSIGLGVNLSAVGLFNFDFSSSWQNTSLLAQMIWYLMEGMSIAQTRPRVPNVETYFVMINEENFVFKKDVFTDQWYFGASEYLENCLPCSYQDYLQAKNGSIHPRLLKQ